MSELQKWIKTLPNPESRELEYLPVIQYIQEEFQPKTMLQIGLNGTNASIWLFTCPQLNFHSIGFHKSISTVAGLLRVKFGKRFDFTITHSRNLKCLGLGKYDVIFIGCLSDLEYAKCHGRYILSDGVALKESKLELIKEFGNGCYLYRNPLIKSEIL